MEKLGCKYKRHNRIYYIIILMINIGIFVFFWLFYQKYLSHVAFVNRDDMYLHGMIAFRLDNAFRNGWNGIHDYLVSDRYPQVITYPGWHLLVVAFWGVVHSVFGMSEESALILSESIVNALCLTLTFDVIFAFFSFRVKYIIPTLSLLFVGPIYATSLIGRYYLGAYTPNIWHNPTYLAVRPLGLLTVFYIIRIFENRIERKREYVLVGVLLVLTALCKPTFYQMFLPALIVFCVLYAIYKQSMADLMICVRIAIACIPVGIVALIQFAMTFGNSQSSMDGGIAIGFLYVWKHFTDHIWWSIITTLLFLLLVYVVATFRKKITLSLALSMIVLVSGFLWYAFCYYKIDPFTADFSWGLASSLSIAFVLCLRWFFVETGDWLMSDRKKPLFIVASTLMFFYLWHLGSGIWYFANIIKRGTFLL